jgi:hypothetical protein
MAAFEVIALDTATPQLRAPGAADTYTFPRAVEMPLGTANGVLYLNGSKVVTSGSGLTFDGTNLGVGTSSPENLFQVAGRFGVSSGGVTRWGQVITTAGRANSGYLTWDTGLVAIGTEGATAMRFDINASEQMRLTSTGLGIGTSSPSNLLTLGGSTGGIDFEGWNDNRIVLRQDFDASYYQQIVFDAANRDFRIQSNSSDSTARVTFWTGASGTVTERMRLDSSGNLGLGVTPSAWASYFAAVQAGNASKGGAFVSAGGFSAYGHNYYEDSGGVNRYIQSTYALKYATQGNGAHAWYTAPAWDGTGSNAISFTQAMTLDAGGRLLVGRTSSTGNNERFQIDANGTSTIYTALFSNTGTATSTYNVVTWIQGATGSATGYIGTGGSAVGNPAFQNAFVVGTQTSNRLVFNTADTEKAHIPVAGGMVVGTAALATSATDGFLYVPTCAGTPTGTPTTQTGTAPIVVDTTNNKLYFYSGGQWRDAGP